MSENGILYSMRPIRYYVEECAFRIKDLLRHNKKRVIVFCIAFALGLILGFRYGFKTEFGVNDFIGSNTLIYRYICDKINLFTYILCQLLWLLLFCAIFIFCSCNVVLTYIAAIVLFYRAYMLAYTLVLLLSIFKLLILPYILVCFLPFMLAYAVLFFLIGLFAGEVCDNGCGGFSIGNASDCALRLVPVLIALAVLVLAEGILLFILTFGIVL